MYNFKNKAVSEYLKQLSLKRLKNVYQNLYYLKYEFARFCHSDWIELISLNIQHNDYANLTNELIQRHLINITNLDLNDPLLILYSLSNNQFNFLFKQTCLILLTANQDFISKGENLILLKQHFTLKQIQLALYNIKDFNIPLFPIQIINNNSDFIQDFIKQVALHLCNKNIPLKKITTLRFSTENKFKEEKIIQYTKQIDLNLILKATKLICKIYFYNTYSQFNLTQLESC